MYFSAENLPKVSPVMMNYKMRHNRIDQRGIVLCDQTIFPLLANICGGRKTEKHGLDMQGYCKGNHGGRLAQCVS